MDATTLERPTWTGWTVRGLHDAQGVRGSNPLRPTKAQVMGLRSPRFSGGCRGVASSNVVGGSGVANGTAGRVERADPARTATTGLCLIETIDTRMMSGTRFSRPPRLVPPPVGAKARGAG